MIATTARPLAAALLLLGMATLAVPGSATAADRDDVIRRGVYHGTWHGDKVKVIVEKVQRNGEFAGLVHFDPTSNWPNAVFEFRGEVGRGDVLTIRRVNDNCEQVASTGSLRVEGRYFVWRGVVTGGGLDRPYPFELRVPR